MEKNLFLRVRGTTGAAFLITAAWIGVVFLFALTGGCGKKVYTPPEKGAISTIVLVNDIYVGGFYVELDGKEAGFLKQQLAISVKPGEHKLKVFNKETTLSLLKERRESTIHEFKLTVDVEEGETKEVVLSWDDPGYSKELRRGGGMEDTEEKRRPPKSGGSLPGMGMP